MNSKNYFVTSDDGRKYKIPDINNFFNQKKTELIAVNNVDIKARYGETIGIVGESGSGKSTLGMSLIKLQDINSGKILFKDEEIQDSILRN